MLILRIRQAETALRDGRLDEAYALAQDAKLWAHRRGQALIGHLARALIERGRCHLAQCLWPQAQADCEKAAKLGGNLTEAAELRQAIADAVAHRQGEDRRRADALAAARTQLDKGQLSLCERMLVDVAGDSRRAAALQGRVAASRAAAEHHLDRARRAVEHADWDAAVDHLLEARRHHPADRAAEELAGRVTAAVVGLIREAFETGRLDRASRLLDRVQSLSDSRVAVGEWRSALARCRHAIACVELGAFRSAGEYLQRVAPVLPGVAWVNEAVEAARQAAEQVERLRGGPLGLLANASPAMAETMAMNHPFHEESRSDPAGDTARAGSGGAALPERFVLHVDGAGSYVVLRKRCVTMGPISSPHRPDVGLLAEAGLPVVKFERVDEDYFVSSDKPVVVNGAPAARKLLADGDGISLSPRSRLKFALPNAASTTGVVSLAGVRLPRGDARHVILLDRTLVIGPGASAHIRMDALAEPIVLHVHDDRLVCRSGQEVIVDDRPLGRSQGIPIGGHVRIDKVSFLLTVLQ